MLLSARRQRSYPAVFLLSSQVILITILLASFPPPNCACTYLERDSLLSFLSGLSSTPNNTLPGSWGVQGDCCLWEGISCDDQGSVSHLWLPLKGLRGRITPSLSNLTSLSHLNLSHNRLSGTLPPALLSSDHLVILDVSFNLLTGGLIVPPSSSSSLPVLQVLNVSSNYFTGVFPSFGSLAVEVNASSNSFSGSIPSRPAWSPFLRILDLSRNQFGGDIPPGLGDCSQLTVFRAGFNNLSGPLPPHLFNADSLKELSLPFNQISGVLAGDGDEERILNLSNLVLLDLSGNQLSGHLPASIGRLANLEQLLLFSNQLSGALPSTLSNCSKLRSLNLRANNLGGELGATDFSALTDLNKLDLSNNSFTGEIPASMYSCRSLTALRLAMNSLQGQIAPGMINLQALSYLSLSYNKLVNVTGAFHILKDLTNLTAILLSGNFIREAIPPDPVADWGSGFQHLLVLGLGDCQLNGQVPSWLAKLTELEALDLSHNQLTGSVPGWLGSLTRLFYLDMSSNRLSGEFPLEITGLPMLMSEHAASASSQATGSDLELPLPVFVQSANASDLQYNQLDKLPPAIYLRNNSLVGMIPPEIGQLKMLHVLDLSHNNFSGCIPLQLCNLTNLEKLDLSGNHLSGTIPPMLAGLHFLSSFSVAYNDLQGPIPSGGQFDTFPNSSFEGNPNLCGSSSVLILHPCTNTSGDVSFPSHRRRPNRNLLVGLGLCFGGAFAVALLAFCILSSTRRKAQHDPVVGINGDAVPCGNSISVAIRDSSLVMVFPGNCETKDLTISDILRATDNFDRANIIGCGGFGTVYKATLANGRKLAIKRLSGDMCLMEREFKAEVEALSTARHKNLVSLQGYCIQGNIRLLMYSYMENGSLDYWLHERDDGASMLDWPTRLKIAQGTSRGLSYIHQICQPHIVHRDIKSSNILLDQEFEAYVADFGLSRLILPYNTHVTTELVGTLGYIPPEYGQAWVATLRGDIYSFGVVMLELLAGRRPVEIFMPKPLTEIVGWVQEMRCQGKHEQVFDSVLRGKGFEEQMVKVLDVACMCVDENPLRRPTIQEVVSWLANVGADRLPADGSIS